MSACCQTDAVHFWSGVEKTNDFLKLEICFFNCFLGLNVESQK